MAARWSEWRLFPDPRKHGELVAPFGPGCYEVRIGEQLLLYGKGNHVAERLTSLLPEPWGCGTRNNASKRADVFSQLGVVEYRTLACGSIAEAIEEEEKLGARRSDYVHQD